MENSTPSPKTKIYLISCLALPFVMVGDRKFPDTKVDELREILPVEIQLSAVWGATIDQLYPIRDQFKPYLKRGGWYFLRTMDAMQRISDLLGRMPEWQGPDIPEITEFTAVPVRVFNDPFMTFLDHRCSFERGHYERLSVIHSRFQSALGRDAGSIRWLSARFRAAGFTVKKHGRGSQMCVEGVKLL